MSLSTLLSQVLNAWAVTKNQKIDLKTIKLWVMDLLEAFLYAIVYGVLALVIGSVSDRMFPPFDAAATLERVLCEVMLQAGFNVVLSVIVRDTVHNILSPIIPDIGHKGERTGTGTSGGIILGTLLTCRQGNWKQKLVLLDSLLSQK